MLPVQVVGVSKLKTKYESHEAKRQLCNSYDMFAADERILPSLPKLLGAGGGQCSAAGEALEAASAVHGRASSTYRGQGANSRRTVASTGWHSLRLAAYACVCLPRCLQASLSSRRRSSRCRCG
jgi:hypothetical protein